MQDLKNLDALLNIEGRQTPITQRELAEIFFNETRTIKTEKLLEYGFLADLPARKMPMSRQELFEISKLSDEELAEVKKYDILSDTSLARQPVTVNFLRQSIASRRSDPDMPLKNLLKPFQGLLNEEFYYTMKDVYAKNGEEVSAKIVEKFNSAKCLGNKGFVKILKEADENGKINMEKLNKAVDRDVEIFRTEMEKHNTEYNNALAYLKENTNLNDTKIQNIAEAVNIRTEEGRALIVYFDKHPEIKEPKYLSLLYACGNNKDKLVSALYGLEKGIDIANVNGIINTQSPDKLNHIFDRLLELRQSGTDIMASNMNPSALAFVALQSDDTINYFKSSDMFSKFKNVDSYRAASDLKPFRDVKSLSELTPSQLRDFASIIQKNSSALADDAFKELNLSKIQPKTESENELISYIAEQSDEIIDYLKSLGMLSKFKDIDSYRAAIDLKPYKDIKSILELTYHQKQDLISKIAKYNSTLLDNDFKQLNISEILPKTREQYCLLLTKLSQSLGISARPLTAEVKAGFDNALDRVISPDGALSKIDLNAADFRLELDYSREKFITDMKYFFNLLPKEEALKVMDYFGFDFRTLPNGMFQMSGYPNLYGGSEKLAQIKDPKTRAVIEEMKPYVKRFSENNRITIKGEPELSQQLNDIVKAFPEFMTTIGKVQHKTHDYTVDVHTLKVLQGVVTNPEFQKLSDSDKKVLSIAVLFHDITKAENLIDKTHPAQGAYDAYNILGKLNLPEAQRLKIYQIIKNHDWLEQYNRKIRTDDGTFRDMTDDERMAAAKKIAFELRQGNAFELASILAEADLKGVKRDGSFFDKYSGALEAGRKEIGELVSSLQSTAIHLPQSTLPSASSLIADGKVVKEMTASDGTKNKVIYMDKGLDLSKYGFPAGSNSDDLNIIVHALETGEQSVVLNALGQVDTTALLSSSYINNKKGNYHVFRQQGFVLDVASDDIHAGYYCDFGSGYKKDLDGLMADYLYGGSRKIIREYFPDKLKQELKLSDEEYKKLYVQISDKSIEEIQQINPEVADAYRKIFKEMEVNYNEFLISRPKIQGVFTYGKTYEQIPLFLRQYAEEHDLPVIIFGQ